MPKNSSLTDFQDALIGLLCSGETEGEILKALESDPRFEEYQDYVKQFDPDMVAVACELIGRWAKRKQSDK